MSEDQKFIEQTELCEKLRSGVRLALIDVRSMEEFKAEHVEGAINIPAAELPARIGEIPTNATIVTICNHGGARSCGAAEQLRSLGHAALPLRGGTFGWRDKEKRKGR